MGHPAKRPSNKRTASRPPRPNVKALADYVRSISDDDIEDFLAALFPECDEDAIEDLYGSILILKRRDEPTRPFKDVMKDLGVDVG